MADCVIEAGKGLWGAARLTFPRLDSTNQRARSLGNETGHGEVIFTLDQHQGRGRYDRSWLAPPGTSLTFSVVLHSIPLEHMPSISLAAALSVRSTLQASAIPARVKWPNDVMVSDKKICGILAEQLDDSLIVGIGLNVNTPVAELHRAGLDRPAISMADYADKRFDLEAVYATLCSELEPRLDHAGSHGMNSIHAEWKDADYFTGQTVSLVQSGTFFRGKYLGLADDGRIGIHTEDGPRYFWSGELRKAE